MVAIKDLINQLDQEWSRYDIPSLLKSTKVYSQLRNIKNLKVKELIMSYYTKALQDTNITKERIHKVYETLLTQEKTYGKDWTMMSDLYLSDFTKDLHEFLLLTMDCYTMARLFRQFKDGTEANYSMIYCGDHHARNYRDIMILLGFKLVNETYEAGYNQFKSGFGTRCLDISKFSLPPFTVTPK